VDNRSRILLMFLASSVALIVFINRPGLNQTQSDYRYARRLSIK
jgi:hypothetical protein